MNKTTYIKGSLLGTLLFFVLTAVLFGADDVPEPKEKLRISMSGSFQPFSTTDDEGSLTGFDADTAREIARRLGRKPVLIQTDWAGIQAGLQGGKYDLICSSMTITKQRMETMHFTLPYYINNVQLFVKEGIEDIRGKRVGVTEDSTYSAYIEDHPDEFPDVEVVYYGSGSFIVAAMNADKIDAFLSNRIVGSFYVRKVEAEDIVVHDKVFFQENCGIAARKDSAGLIHEVNGALFSMIQDGTYSKLYEKWVGEKPDTKRLLETWAEYHKYIPPLEGGEERRVTDKPTFAENVASMLPLLGKGAVLTLELSVLSAVLALIFGSLIGVGSISRSVFLRYISGGFVWVVRGTPLLVQLFISYYGLAMVINRIAGFELVGAFGAALIALTVNTSAYNAETLRGGINAIEKGQWDAASSLGMTRPRILRRIILPQAFRDALPSLGNNLVILIKDTSLVGAITLIELTYAARNVVFQTGQAFLPFIMAAVFYLAMVLLVTVAVNVTEAFLQRSRQRGGRNI